MEDVCRKTGVTDQQLDQEISESDIILLAEKFPHLLSVRKVGHWRRKLQGLEPPLSFYRLFKWR